VFEEVFTHAGSGTLFTEDYPNILRPAIEGDVREIMAIMQPYVAEGALKPVTEEELLKVVRSFMVYSVNGQIVCAAALIPYGNSCELGKLCTLPRFQARGRARALVLALIDEARKQGRDAIFALTVQPYVGEFFEKLGFVQVPREELPDEWKKGYDFSRPSKGYSYKLD
jgi:amino-acid N-acetyltransferase